MFSKFLTFTLFADIKSNTLSLKSKINYNNVKILHKNYNQNKETLKAIYIYKLMNPTKDMSKIGKHYAKMDLPVKYKIFQAK